ncbi:MAG: hypothetical protein ISR57_04020 [Bacteroidales bacterium]|nr:hypothetical protein [Bacteroidota bacterium]MBL6949793.1 hypothetical protein [Bacteroidales bacterium]
MRSLFFASIILIVILGCVSVKPKDLRQTAESSNPIYSFHFEKALFRASMEVKKNELTGLVFIKKMPDSTYRIVFSNEFGMTYFDLEIHEDSFQVIYCFEPMNKKMLLNILEIDFRLLIGNNSTSKGKWYLQELTNHQVYHVKDKKFNTWNTFSTNCDTLLSQTASSNIFNQTIINYLAYRDSFPSKIHIQNPFINLDLKLTLLSK